MLVALSFLVLLQFQESPTSNTEMSLKHSKITLLLTIFTSLITAAPHSSYAPAPQPAANLTNFLLVVTSQADQTLNSSLLADVSATSLFDPYNQKNFLLRLIGPGYNSLPTFNISDGALHTLSYGILGSGMYEYNSTEVENGGEFQFLPEEQPKPSANGSLALQDGYLLTVGGKQEGWTICPGALGESVISWKNSSSSCNATYIQAVKVAPY